MLDYLPHLTVFALVEAAILCIFVPWVLLSKRDPMAALSWLLVVVFMPLVGAILFWVFGYQRVVRPLRAKRVHRAKFRLLHPPGSPQAIRGGKDQDPADPDAAENSSLAKLALSVEAFPVSSGNSVTLYHETTDAFQALLAAIDAARNHVHLQFFILRSDDTTRRLVEHLTAKAKVGVEVRLLYDSLGGWSLNSKTLQPLVEAGGMVHAFLPINPFRSWIRVNLRNHRKIVVIDGRVAFTGGMNIGDEYLGLSKRFGYWRDAFLKIEGPAAAGLQRVFVEDWHYATDEAKTSHPYFPMLEPVGSHTVQVVESGPDQDHNSIREVYFAAILAARERLWIASPYFVPDAGLLDALWLARRRGVDLRILCLGRPDHFVSFHASRYYLTDMLAAGVKVYEYERGMMHSKLVLVDDRYAIIGSANLDNRSLHLNFEVSCILYTKALIEELSEAYLRDLRYAIELDKDRVARRPLRLLLAENACRLFSPIL